MSATPFLILSIGAALLSVPLIVVPTIKWRTREKATQLKYVSRFFELAPKIVSDERLPYSLVEVLEMVSHSITDRSIVSHLLWSWLFGRMGKQGRTEKQVIFNKSVNDLPPELRDRVATAFAYGLVGVTYSAPLAGTVLRRLLFSPVGMPQRTDDAPMFAYQAIQDCRA